MLKKTAGWRLVVGFGHVLEGTSSPSEPVHTRLKQAEKEIPCGTCEFIDLETLAIFIQDSVGVHVTPESVRSPSSTPPRDPWKVDAHLTPPSLPGPWAWLQGRLEPAGITSIERRAGRELL